MLTKPKTTPGLARGQLGHLSDDRRWGPLTSGPKAARARTSAPCPPLPPQAPEEPELDLGLSQRRGSTLRRAAPLVIAVGALGLMAAGRPASSEGVAAGAGISASEVSEVIAPSFAAERAEHLSLADIGRDQRDTGSNVNSSAAGSPAPGSDEPSTNPSGPNGSKDAGGESSGPNPPSSERSGSEPLLSADVPLLGSVTLDEPEELTAPEVPGVDLLVEEISETSELLLP